MTKPGSTTAALTASVQASGARSALGSRHLCLLGPMGVGKSTLAPLLASALDRTAIDLDAEIARTAGRSVAVLFAELGEAGFRDHEATALREALAGPPAVIACGGGAALAEANRALLREGAFCLGLFAPASLLAARVAGDTARPLAGDAATLQRLLGERRGRHAEALDLAIAAGDVAPDALCQRALSALAMTPAWLRCAAEEGQEALLAGPGCLDAALPAIARLGGGRVAVVSDATVMALHGHAIASALEALGCMVERHVIAGAEATKTLATYSALVTALVAGGGGRDLLVVAVGGGVVCDIAGFAAATALRGVRHVLIPTTLLAQVDAAIGGKTGVDTAAGKNLVGAFHPARLVACEGELLRTLPAPRWAEGLAELSKTALVADADLWAAMEAAAASGTLRRLVQAEGVSEGVSEADRAAVGDLAGRCAVRKRSITAADPREAGLRRCLNFGHTFGHALERTVGYGVISHGEAVAIGMRLALDLGVALAVTPPGLRDRALGLLEACALPTTLPHHVEPEQLLSALGHDKKAEGAGVRFILVPAAGSYVERWLTAGQIAASLGW